ncbi:MAG: CPBP family intramembrane metalloprotease [Syntrophomonadaceae bacterium]|nr:CPBP family intramembrane metalloprotease [Syntrophomonadaceae bacterium]
MFTSFVKPRWGLVEILIVYIGIMLIGYIFGMSGDMVSNLFALLGIPDVMLSYFYFGFLVQFISTVCLVLIMTLLINRAQLRDIGIYNVSINKYLQYGVLGGVLLLVIIFTLSLPISILQPDLEPQLYEEMLRSITKTQDFVFLFIIGAVLAPLSEELFYRGMIYPVLRHHFGPIPAMIIAGIIFGLAHYDLWRFVPLAVGGAILCYLYEKTNSIFVTTLAHGVWNGVMSLIVYFSIINTF